MVYLRILDYREETLEPGRKSTCAICGEEIVLKRIADSWKRSGGKWFRGTWVHKGEKIDEHNYSMVESNTKDHVGKPRYFCMWEIGEGAVCGKPIKHEDMEARHFACGTHMRKELDRVAAEERAEKARQKEEEANALQKWHVQQYAMARARLINIGLGDIFDHYNPDANAGVWRRNNQTEDEWEYKVNRIHKFDVLEFEKTLMELLRREMPDDFPSGEDDGEKQRLDALADELFS